MSDHEHRWIEIDRSTNSDRVRTIDRCVVDGIDCGSIRYGFCPIAGGMYDGAPDNTLAMGEWAYRIEVPK